MNSEEPPRVSNLIPFVGVADVPRSIGFYAQLGFVAKDLFEHLGTPVWAALASEGAELMLERSGEPIDPDRQRVMFYLYSYDLAALRDRLLAGGTAEVGEIVDGSPGPSQEMRLTDPDGYVLMVAQIE